jgi:hypothetical protein
MRFTSNVLRAAACVGVLVIGAPASGSPLQDQSAPRGPGATHHDGDRMPESCGIPTEVRRDKFPGRAGVVCGMDANGNPLVLSVHRSMRFPAITTSASE